MIPASAKTGLGIQDILTAIIERIPSPKGSANEPLQALIFDSVYNPFRGVETYFRVINGKIRKGQKRFNLLPLSKEHTMPMKLAR